MSTPTPKLTFRKAERLCSKKTINLIFEEKKTLFAFPLQVFYRKVELHGNTPKMVVIFSVPKRHIKKATGRNTIKRRLREAFRLNKIYFSELLEQGEQLQLIFIYKTNELLPFKIINEQLCRLLEQIIKTVRK